MKKIVCAFLAAVTIGTCLVGCGKEAEGGYKTIKDETCEFTFRYPEDWNVLFDSGILAIEKPGDESKARIVGHCYSRSEDEVESTTAKEYWDNNYLPMLTNMYGEENLVVTATEPVMYKHSGKEFEEVCASYTKTLGDDVYSCKVIIILAQDRVCTLTLTQKTKDKNGDIAAADYTDVLMKCLETFTIRMF